MRSGFTIFKELFMPIHPPLTRKNATLEQLAAEAKARFEQLKKWEKFDLAGKQAEIEKAFEKVHKLQEEMDAYFDFLGIPKDEPEAPAEGKKRKKGATSKGEGISISLQDLK